MEMAKISGLSQTKRQMVVFKSQCILPPPPQLATVIHWLIVNGVTVGRPECDHNSPTINIWWAVSRRGGGGGGQGHISPIRTTPPRPLLQTFILLRTGNSRLRREIVFG